MLINQVEYRSIKPDHQLSNFVDSYWMLYNTSDQQQEVVIVPDGRVDIFFSVSEKMSYQVIIRGLDSTPGISSILGKKKIFAVSLTLLSVEYVLGKSIASLLNGGSELPTDFWGILAEDSNDFDSFCEKLSHRIASLAKEKVDERKRKLVELLYSSNGSMTVKELSERVRWSSRQINRYFNQWFGLSLKTYCTILRFSASFKQLREGKLFPEKNFADQAHFIHEVKKYAGVAPKELSKNSNDRFIQFWALPAN